MFRNTHLTLELLRYLIDTEALNLFNVSSQLRKMRSCYVLKDTWHLSKYHALGNPKPVLDKVWWSPQVDEVPVRFPNVITFIDDYFRNPNRETLSYLPNDNDVYIHEWGIEFFMDHAHSVKHRVGGPAMIAKRGGEVWYHMGVLHRVDGPALVDAVTICWYQKGVLHRVDGPALIYKHSSIRKWYLEGRLHRENGPAECTDRSRKWYWKGRLHREDGPAVEYFCGEKNEYWKHGEQHWPLVEYCSMS